MSSQLLCSTLKGNTDVAALRLQDDCEHCREARGLVPGPPELGPISPDH